MKILIATENSHKFKKFSGILAGFSGAEILSLGDVETLDIDENGATFEENAVIKAREYSRVFDGLVVATDGGMDIPALPDWNRLFTRRFAGAGATDSDRIEKILEKMKDFRDDDRKMTWQESIAVAQGGEKLFSFTADGASGLMAEKFDLCKYRDGIWLCSLWEFPQFGGKNFFDLSDEEIAEVEISWRRLGVALGEYLGSAGFFW